MGRIPTIPILLLLIIVSFSILPSGVLLKQAQAQAGPSPLTIHCCTARDGNDIPVEDGGTTSSTTITIHFRIDGGDPPYSSICSVNPKETHKLVPCNESVLLAPNIVLYYTITFTGLKQGLQQFGVITKDSNNNQTVGSFSWHIKPATLFPSPPTSSLAAPPPLSPIQATQQLEHEEKVLSAEETQLGLGRR